MQCFKQITKKLYVYIYVYIYIYYYNISRRISFYEKSLETYHMHLVRESLNKFPDFFRMGTFIPSTHMKLLSPSK